MSEDLKQDNASPAPSLLTPQRIALYGGAALGLIAVFLYLNHKFKSHQTLRLVNFTPREAVISATDVPETFVPPRTNDHEIVLPEGDYKFKIRMGSNSIYDVDFKLRNSMYERFFGDKTFILNIGAAAVLLIEKALYSDKRISSKKEIESFILNQDTVVLSGIDYVFTKFPDELYSRNRNEIIKKRLGILNVPLEEIFEILSEHGVSVEQVLAYLERQLMAAPENEWLMMRYFNLCLGKQYINRGIAFLETGLNRRPVNFAWHRYYQRLRAAKSDGPTELRAEYDHLLSGEPEDSSLLFLRGKLAENKKVALTFYDKAIKADQENFLAWLAKAEILYQRGDFLAARKACETAVLLQPDLKRVRSLFYKIQFALRENSDLERELTTVLRQNPLDYSVYDLLIQVYYSDDKKKEAGELMDKFLSSMTFYMSQDPYELKKLVELNAAYYKKDIREFSRISKTFKAVKTRKNAEFNANIAQLKVRAAEKLTNELGPNERSGFNSLLIFLGWRILGDKNQAIIWLSDAIEQFKSGSSEGEVEAVRLLSKNYPDMLLKVDNADLAPFQKAILCVSLAALYPKTRATMLQFAEKMNFDLRFPHLSLKDFILRMKSEKCTK